ncbi:growth hormone receptor-like [Scyliorhinus torazame]|uniref:growth hormone receptor-like n=1 Tax=Scyliorhinus torazame TaxID=75743 RepID=UPI003B5AB8B4
MAALWVTWCSLAVVFIDSVCSSDGPTITECRSLEQETFACRWSEGNNQNLTQHSQLKFFYNNGHSPSWRECPISQSGESTCYLNQSDSREAEVCVRLQSDNVTHQQRCFTFHRPVEADVPISLNWALLNISRSGLLMDIQLWWQDPVSSDVSSGWNSRRYEIQYKAGGAELWESVGVSASVRQQSDQHHQCGGCDRSEIWRLYEYPARVFTGRDGDHRQSKTGGRRESPQENWGIGGSRKVRLCLKWRCQLIGMRCS